MMVLSLFISANSFAADVTIDDMNFMKQKQEELKVFKEQFKGMTVSLPPNQQDLLDKHTADIAAEQQKAAKENQEPKYIYFVSYSVPDEGLISMVNDAKRYGITPTMRGLVKNDFRETAKKTFSLSKQDKNFGVAVDPFLFRDYNIKAVPALVISCGAKHDLVYGSLPVKEALEKIVHEGDCSNEAKNILANAHS